MCVPRAAALAGLMAWGPLAVGGAACSADVYDLDGGSGGTDIGPGEDKVCGTEGELMGYRWGDSELVGCTSYRGSLRVWCPDGTQDLSRLSGLREVDGGLTIEFCFDLTSLRGLDGLERVASLRISKVPLLQDLEALASLRSVSGELSFSFMEGLVSFHGLEGVESVGGKVLLRELDALERLDGLERLRTVGGLDIEYNDNLHSLAGLAGLQLVDGRFETYQNAALPRSEIDALLSRIEVTGSVVIE